MKCKTCNDRGYIISPEAWNTTIQEHVECPDCMKEIEKNTTKHCRTNHLTH